MDAEYLYSSGYMENNNHEHNGIIKVIEKDFFSIPVSIRMVSLSVFLFIL